MAGGGLVPDDVVVGIISDRIEEPDAKRGFILDGFPRTVPQAEALDDLLKHKHMKLDAVIELRVNESALLQRVETRAAETRARGEEVRIDDTPEVLIKRLASYRSMTEPLIHYYSEKRKLVTIDGMMTIEEVTREISRILQAIGAVDSKASKKAPSAKRSTKKVPARAAKSAVQERTSAKKPVKTARKAAKRAAAGAKKGSRRAFGRPTKKVTKKRAKA